MTSVSTSLNTSGYYTLPTASTSTLPTSISTGALYLQAVSQSSNDTVTLSDAAKAYLENKAGGSSNTDSTFTLSTSQQQQIATIVAKYKDAPLTQDTFDSIQDDLKAAGLSADQLSAKDRIAAFNPELEFLNAQNGVASNLPSGADEQTKSTNYINQVYAQLKAISTQTVTS